MPWLIFTMFVVTPAKLTAPATLGSGMYWLIRFTETGLSRLGGMMFPGKGAPVSGSMIAPETPKNRRAASPGVSTTAVPARSMAELIPS